MNQNSFLAPHLISDDRHGTVMAVSMMKDEAPYLLEWVAHHLAVGFTDILVYTNDCTDGTVELLQRLEELGLAVHRPNDIPEGIKPQPSAINYAQKEPLVQKADWVILFDADEFLCINHPSGDLAGMLDDVMARGANGVVITWRIFGSGGVVDWSRAPVTEQYLRAAPPAWNKGWGVKTLFRFDPEYWKLGIHRPSIKNKHLEDGFPDTVHWLNGSGHPMEDYFKFRGWRSIRRTVGYGWAQMNHYAVKSVDAYAVRKFRGNVNNKKNKYNADYWALQDRNEVEDRAILRHAPRRAQIMAALLEDPVLRDLHETALTRIEARLDEFRQTEDYAKLKADLLAAGQLSINDVEAAPPKARDPEKIAALMNRVEQKSKTARSDNVAPQRGPSYVEGDIDLSADISPQWVPNHEVELPADPRIFTPDALNAVLSGRFERRHARNIKGYLDGGTRLLDLDCGVGFIAIKALRDLPELTVLAHDLRPALIQMAAEIAARAGAADTPQLDFQSGPLNLPGLIAGHSADILRLGRAGAVSPDVLDSADLSGLMRVVMPFDAKAEERMLRDAYAPMLARHGLIEDPERAGSGSLQFDRSS